MARALDRTVGDCKRAMCPVPLLRFIAFSLLGAAVLRKSTSSDASDAFLSLQARRLYRAPPSCLPYCPCDPLFPPRRLSHLRVDRSSKSRRAGAAAYAGSSRRQKHGLTAASFHCHCPRGPWSCATTTSAGRRP